MDIVGVEVVATFFSMLAVSVFGMQAQKPPSISADAPCPASGEIAQLSMRWDKAHQSLAVEACSGQAFNHGACGQGCLAILKHTAGHRSQPRDRIT